jgi:hypothetical protein
MRARDPRRCSPKATPGGATRSYLVLWVDLRRAWRRAASAAPGQGVNRASPALPAPSLADPPSVAAPVESVVPAQGAASSLVVLAACCLFLLTDRRGGVGGLATIRSLIRRPTSIAGGDYSPALDSTGAVLLRSLPGKIFRPERRLSLRCSHPQRWTIGGLPASSTSCASNVRHVAGKGGTTSHASSRISDPPPG